MTIEERVEFLTQSIESHDCQIAALVENAAATDRLMAQLGKRMEARDAAAQLRFDRLDTNTERVQLNIDRLAQAMLGLTGHAADHARRVISLPTEFRPRGRRTR